MSNNLPAVFSRAQELLAAPPPLTQVQREESKLARFAKARIAGLFIYFTEAEPQNPGLLDRSDLIPESLQPILAFEMEKLGAYVKDYVTSPQEVVEAVAIVVAQAITNALTWLQNPDDRLNGIRIAEAKNHAQAGARAGNYSLPGSDNVSIG